MIDDEHLSRLHVIVGGDGAKKRDGQGRSVRHSASCRVENDCERDQQQAPTITNYHLALSTILPQQPRISLLNHCAQHEARQVRLFFGRRSSMRISIMSQTANTTPGF